jgi:hypothetical protein
MSLPALVAAPYSILLITLSIDYRCSSQYAYKKLKELEQFSESNLWTKSKYKIADAEVLFLPNE